MKELRQERGITMKDAAQQLNLPYTTYVNYEKGTREPNSETLIQIANFYNTSIDYLLGKSDTRIDDRVLDIVNELDFDA
ncbi:MAG: helix-turn-helix domain-containing protein, partial [Gemmiger sp.]